MRYLFCILLLLTVVPRTPSAIPVPEYSWASGKTPSHIHWECPRGYFVFWGEENVVVAGQSAPPLCVTPQTLGLK